MIGFLVGVITGYGVLAAAASMIMGTVGHDPVGTWFLSTLHVIVLPLVALGLIPAGIFYAFLSKMAGMSEAQLLGQLAGGVVATWVMVPPSDPS